MYICNFKFNIKKILIICFIIAVAIALIIEVCGIIKEREANNYDYVLDSKNFTNTLKAVHEDIEGNVGKTVKLSGFIFRLPDFKEGYFVCGRDMMLNNEEKVVGFLCTYNNIKNFSDSEWVEITGKFVKGYYMTDMPVIEVNSINKITAPANTFVETPNFL